MTNPFKSPPVHVHTWELVSSTYAPAKPQIPVGNFSDETVQKLLLGVTTLLFSCVECHEHKKEEMIGSEDGGESDKLDDLMTKANVTPQIVNRGAETYVLQRYLTDAEIAALPIR